MNYQLYAIKDAAGIIRYVGITRETKGYKNRFDEHCAAAISQVDETLVHTGMLKNGVDKCTVKLLMHSIPSEQIDFYEQLWIKKLHTYYLEGSGWNMTRGGGGNCGYEFTRQDKEKISHSSRQWWINIKSNNPEEYQRQCELRSLKLKGRPKSEVHKLHLSQSRKGRFTKDENSFYGKHHTDQTKELIGNKNRGKKRSEEVKRQMSKSRTGKKFSEKHKQRLSECNAASKQVFQYTLQGELITSFISGAEAERQTGVKRGGILSCCNGHQKTSGGFIWRFN